MTNTTPDDLPDPAPPTPPLPAIFAAPTPLLPSSDGNAKAASSSENVAPLPLSQQPASSAPKYPPGISIISRFPNSRNEQEAKGHNLAETVKRTSPSSAAALPNIDSPNKAAEVSPPQTSRVLHDFQSSSRRRLLEASTTTASTSGLVPPPHTGNTRSALSRLTDSTAVLSRSLADSSSGLNNHHHFMHRHHQHHHNRLAIHQQQQQSTTATQQLQQQQNADIQCNEISSSDDDTPQKARSGALPPLPPPIPSRKGILKESRLSRELSALQLDSPLHRSVTHHLSRRHRKRSHSANTSDAENEDLNDVTNRRLRSASGGRPFTDVELKCRELNAKIRNIERKVAQKTQQLNQEVRLLQSTLMKSSASSSHFLRSSTTPTKNVIEKSTTRNGVKTSSMTTTPRSLRPRSGVPTPCSVSCSSLRKRKLVSDGSSSSICRNLESGSVAKSPRRSMSATSVVPIQKKPIMTRSRKARVLQLKK